MWTLESNNSPRRDFRDFLYKLFLFLFFFMSTSFSRMKSCGHLNLLSPRWSLAKAVPLSGPVDAQTTFTFGYVRMAAPAYDSTGVLAGLLASVKYYNDNDIIHGVRFVLDVTTIACVTSDACQNLSATHRTTLQRFMESMGNYSAVIKPSAVIAPAIVDEARRLGGIPVINPFDMRVGTFRAGSDHVINFRQSWRSQTEHLFTFMMQNGRCARSGIIHEQIPEELRSEYDDQMDRIREMFARGKYPVPPSLDARSAADDAFYNFFFSDMPRRRCYIVLGSASLVQVVLERLALNSTFSERSFFFYGVSQIMSDAYFSNTSSTLYRNVYFTHWLPPIGDSSSTVFSQALIAWLSNVSSYDQSLIHASESYPSNIANNALSAYEGYLTAVLSMESVRNALGFARSGEFNASSVVPLPWPRILDALYRDAKTIDGFQFNKLIRECPNPPAPQLCFCNVLGSSSYMFRINTTTGAPYRLFDDYSTGQRDVSYVRFPSQCGYSISSWSYPIVALAMYPDYLLAGSAGNSRLDDEKASYDLFQRVFGTMTRETNYEPTPPTRALRYAAYDVPNNRTDFNNMVNLYIDTLKPFIIYGSLSTSLQGTQDILTLLPTFLGMSLEDPVLVPHAQWRWTAIQLRPTLADYIHAHVGYYATNAQSFTSVKVLASTAAEALLVSKSFATWGFDLPVSSIVVTGDVAVWSSMVTAVLTDVSSSRPFMLVASQNNNNSLIETAARTAGTVSRGTLAIACSIAVTYKARLATNFSLSTGSSDIIFGAFNREWWLPAAYVGVLPELVSYVVEPRYHVALLAIQISRQLYSQVFFDYQTTAAEILYRAAVISAGGTSLGPFSNTTCSAQQIAANARDRTCQCTKGIRTIFVHSMRDFMANRTSTRTERYSYTMTTCGISYSDYVPPPTLHASVLGRGAIAGIAVGSSAFVLLVLTYVVYIVYFSGRDNSAAPKDPSQPFAIVFTDIQSSTSLWARAPTAMSEAIDQHHRLLRKALRSYGGYEVKTVGDSFMVAFKRAEDAISFSLAAQTSLFEAEWNDEIDATYSELFLEAEIEAAEHGVEGDDTVSEVTTATNTQTQTNPNAGLVHSNMYTMSAQHGNTNRAAAKEHPMIVKSIHASDTESIRSFSVSAPSGGPATANLHHLQKGDAMQHHSVGLPSVQLSHAGNHVARSPKSPSGWNNRSAFGMAVKAAGGHNTSVTFTEPSADAAHHFYNKQQHGSFRRYSNNMPTNGAQHATTGALLVPPNGTTNGRGGQFHPSEYSAGQNASLSVGGGVGGNTHHPNTLATSFGGEDSMIASHGPISVIAAAGDENAPPKSSTRHSLSPSHGGDDSHYDLVVKVHLSDPQPAVRHANREVQQGEENTKYKNAAMNAWSPKIEGGQALATETAPIVSASASVTSSDRRIWNGLRVRIGVHFGLGDIRRDQTTQGYDYYGTVVNTAARVEGVGHGGQILLTQEAYSAVSPNYFHKADAIVIALGPQPLRGLDEPIRLHQVVPGDLRERRFPPLRLHVEKETEDESSMTDVSGTNTSAETPEALISRLCASKQFSSSVTATELLDRYYYFTAVFGPTTDKYKATVISKLADAWGIPKEGGAGGSRQSVALIGRVTKAYKAANKRRSRNNGKDVTGGARGNGTSTTADTQTRDGTVHTAAGTRRGSRSTTESHVNNNTHNDTNNQGMGYQTQDAFLDHLALDLDVRPH